MITEEIFEKARLSNPSLEKTFLYYVTTEDLYFRRMSAILIDFRKPCDAMKSIETKEDFRYWSFEKNDFIKKE
jgi:hypothetical protein